MKNSAAFVIVALLIPACSPDQREQSQPQKNEIATVAAKMIAEEKAAIADWKQCATNLGLQDGAKRAKIDAAQGEW